MKKNAAVKAGMNSDDKSIFRQAGEMIGGIGARIVHAKDNIVGFVSDEYVEAKKVTKKIAGKVKKVAKKPVKKVTKKTAKAKKSAKKVLRKKSTNKAVKKSPARKK
jgi:hypothetical protein